MGNKYKHYRQLDYMDCGPTCIRMIASYYGKEYSLEYLRSKSDITDEGVSLLGLTDAAEKIGFKTLLVKLTYEQLIEEAPLPCILHWNQQHFVVLYDIKTSYSQQLKYNFKEFTIADPGHDFLTINQDVFKKYWIDSSNNRGIALLIEPKKEFSNINFEGIRKQKKLYTFFNNLYISIRKWF